MIKMPPAAIFPLKTGVSPVSTRAPAPARYTVTNKPAERNKRSTFFNVVQDFTQFKPR
jgi:hypothetical protein